MNTTHTPSPWKLGTMVNQQALGIFPDSAQIGELSDAICLISPLAEVRPIDMANAQLIATAPELLETLTEAHNLLQRLNIKETDTQSVFDIILKMQSIIKKAMG